MNAPHRFCWVDLATSNERQAAHFYRQLFGWHSQRQTVGTHCFDTLEQNGAAFASLYRIAQENIARGVPSHWLPYVSTPELDATLQATLALDGRVLVSPQRYPGFARIAVIADPTGAMLGLWENAAG